MGLRDAQPHFIYRPDIRFSEGLTLIALFGSVLRLFAIPPIIVTAKDQTGKSRSTTKYPEYTTNFQYAVIAFETGRLIVIFEKQNISSFCEWSVAGFEPSSAKCVLRRYYSLSLCR